MRSNALRHPARLAGASLLRLQSDERLLELAADGHEAAFAAIVDRYRGPLLRYCAGIVGPGRAEDAVQQTLINAHAALARSPDVHHLRSWIYRIAHNASLNLLRSVRDDVPLDAGQPSAADEPHAAYERAERLRATLETVRDLPERQRAALLLRELEGRSHEEIATALGVTAGSARQHVMRARASVRAAVTAITPYPLLVKLSTSMMAGGQPGLGGWSEAAAGAGLGATMTKLTAGVLATGALVGGAVGTTSVVRHGHHRDGAHAAPAPAARAAGAGQARDVVLVRAGAAVSAPGGSGAAQAGSRSAAGHPRGHGAGRRWRHGRHLGSTKGPNAATTTGDHGSTQDSSSSGDQTSHDGTDTTDGRTHGSRGQSRGGDHSQSGGGQAQGDGQSQGQGGGDAQSTTAGRGSGSGDAGQQGDQGSSGGNGQDHAGSTTSTSGDGSGSSSSGGTSASAPGIDATAPGLDGTASGRLPPLGR